jgi:hypothetical protein
LPLPAGIEWLSAPPRVLACEHLEERSHSNM